ncbi:MAG: OmpA family protein [Elusimicrobia bacterium]|nr:OmpA family protein [Elusimicrobiota bacterium]
MKTAMRWVIVCGACVAMMAPPAKLFADDLTGRVAVGGALGAAVPVGSKVVTDRNDTGLGLGGWVAYGLSSRWSARLSYDNLDLTRGPVRVEPLHLSAAYALCPDSKWNPSVRAGIGPDFVRAVVSTNKPTVFGFGAGLAIDRFITSNLSIGAALDWFADLAKQHTMTRDVHILRPGITAAFWFGEASQSKTAAQTAEAEKAAQDARAAQAAKAAQAAQAAEAAKAAQAAQAAEAAKAAQAAQAAEAAKAAQAAQAAEAAKAAQAAQAAQATQAAQAVQRAPVTMSQTTPAAADLQAGGSQSFAAAVTGNPNTNVTWSLDPQVGSISPAGVYTAPTSIAQDQTVTVTATSVADPAKKTSSQVRLKASEKIEVALDVQFDTDKDAVKPEYDDQLKKVAAFFKDHPSAKAEIEGHTDSAGNAAHNLDLSQRRAKAVRKALIDRFQADGSRLTAKGYGQTRPIADNTTAEGKARNRRVVAAFTVAK